MTTRSRVLRGAVLGAILLAVLSLLEYVGVTESGYGWAATYSLIFALVWTTFDLLGIGRRGGSR